MNYTCKPTEKDYRLFAKNVLPYATDKRLLPFALTVDGKEKLGFGKTPVKETFEILDSTMERRTFTARFRNEKLELTVETLVYRDYPVAEWVATLKNVGKTPSGMITNFKIAKNLRLHSPNAKLHHNTGDGYRAEGLETFVTPMLKKMEEEGLLKRTRCADDERTVLITLTETGHDLKEKAGDIPAKVGPCVPLSKEEAETLYRLLYQIMSEEA